MHDRIFLATTGNGIARAACSPRGEWSVAVCLHDRRVRCLAVDPLNPNVVYAGTHAAGVLRSPDKGRTWQSSGMQGRIIQSLAVSSHEPGLLYAGTKPPCVFVSRDGGASWVELESFRHIRFRWLWRSPAEPPDWRAYVQGLALSPTDPGIIVAGIEFGAVVRSADGGRTWSNHLRGALRDCHSLIFHARDGSWVYEAGGTGGGAAVSRDGGGTWQQFKAGLDRHYGWACAADAERPDVWYVSAAPMPSLFSPVPPAHKDGQANACIFRSAGGAPWEKVGDGLPETLDYMAYALLTDPALPGHVYAGLSNGEVWHSASYGDRWQQLPFNLGSIRAMVMML